MRGSGARVSCVSVYEERVSVDPREGKYFLAHVILAPWSNLMTFVVGCEFAYRISFINSPFFLYYYCH